MARDLGLPSGCLSKVPNFSHLSPLCHGSDSKAFVTPQTRDWMST